MGAVAYKPSFKSFWIKHKRVGPIGVFGNISCDRARCGVDHRSQGQWPTALIGRRVQRDTCRKNRDQGSCHDCLESPSPQRSQCYSMTGRSLLDQRAKTPETICHLMPYLEFCESADVLNLWLERAFGTTLLRGLLEALSELGDRGSAAARGSLYRTPGLAGADHAADAVIALDVLCTALVAALSQGFCLALGLAPAPVDVILAGDRGEHVEQHAVDGFKHAGGEFLAGLRSHGPTG